jgi:hypothetical protein
MLSLVLGSSPHAFELMLSAFIFGLAFGGLWVQRRIDHIGDPVFFLVQGTARYALSQPGYGQSATLIVFWPDLCLNLPASYFRFVNPFH